MKIRILSDLHHEFYRGNNWKDQPWACNAGEDILIMAGDIASGSTNVIKTIDYFLDDLCVPKIIYVPGNHEYYGTSIVDFNEKLKSKASVRPRLTVMNPGYHFDGRVLYVGGPLWTSFKMNPVSMHQAKTMISDFRRISDATPQLYADMHHKEAKLLKDTIKLYEGIAESVVVVTHWLPSHALIAPEFKKDTSGLNSYFANDMDNLMLDISESKKFNKLVWVYGHTHTAGREVLHGWDCIANPEGYPNEFRSACNPALILEI